MGLAGLVSKGLLLDNRRERSPSGVDSEDRTA
jgi:hypothetical protein